MPLHNRPYWRDDGGGGGGGGGTSLGMPRPGRAVGGLLIANVAVFIIELLVGPGKLYAPFAVIPADWWQLWRYVTFQFLHGGFLQLLFNMVGLYFLGMHLEAAWGPRRFLRFYLICGAVAGVCHVLASFALNGDPMGPLVGASGGVFAVLLACAVFFPQIRILVGFIIPISIRMAAVIFLGIAGLYMMANVAAVMRGDHPMGGGVSNPAHLGGALAAAVWIWIVPMIRGRVRFRPDRRGRGRWERKRRAERAHQEEIDQILDKIRDRGIGALSRSEKRKLQQETQRQRRDE